MNQDPSPISVTLEVIQVLELMDIDYFIAGSLASAVYGVSRSTMDADLVADLGIDQVEDFVSQLKTQFVTDEDMIRDAIRHQSSFNLIHRNSIFKVDVFIPNGVSTALNSRGEEAKY